MPVILISLLDWGSLDWRKLDMLQKQHLWNIIMPSCNLHFCLFVQNVQETSSSAQMFWDIWLAGVISLKVWGIYFEMCAVTLAAAIKQWVVLSPFCHKCFIISVRFSLHEIMCFNVDFLQQSTNTSLWDFMFQPIQCTHITLKFIFTYIFIMFTLTSNFSFIIDIFGPHSLSILKPKFLNHEAKRLFFSLGTPFVWNKQVLGHKMLNKNEKISSTLTWLDWILKWRVWLLITCITVWPSWTTDSYLGILCIYIFFPTFGLVLLVLSFIIPFPISINFIGMARNVSMVRIHKLCLWL